MRKILLPTDFSENALAAFLYAVPLAARMGADLVVAHVIKKPTLPNNSPLEMYEAAMEKEAQNAWVEMRRQVARKQEALPPGAEVRVVPEVMANTFVLGINQVVAQQNASLIIMGTKGATGLKRMFLGSNTTDLIERARVPLLAVPAEASFQGLRKIVVALNLKEFAGTDCLHLVRQMVQTFGSSVTVLTVVQAEEPTSRKEEVGAAIGQVLEVPLEWVEVRNKNTVSAIQEYISNHRPDLLVLLPQPRSIWQQLFNKSLRYEFVFRPQIPVLVIPVSTPDL